jgi:predicted ATPase
VTRVPAQLDAALAELAAAELIAAPSGDDDLGQWSFRSRLVRDVAYDSTLRRRRPLAHRAAADALVALGEDTSPADVELIAHHLAQGDEPVLALPYLRRSAEHALAHNAADAGSRLHQALQIASDHGLDPESEEVAWFREQAESVEQVGGNGSVPSSALPSGPGVGE